MLLSEMWQKEEKFVWKIQWVQIWIQWIWGINESLVANIWEIEVWNLEENLTTLRAVAVITMLITYRKTMKVKVKILHEIKNWLLSRNRYYCNSIIHSCSEFTCLNLFNKKYVCPKGLVSLFYSLWDWDSEFRPLAPSSSQKTEKIWIFVHVFGLKISLLVIYN